MYRMHRLLQGVPGVIRYNAVHAPFAEMTYRRVSGSSPGTLLLLCLAAVPCIGLSAVQPKPVRVEREYIRPDSPTTWKELLRRSDAVVELTAQAAAGGEAKYYGNFTSVVTANTAVVERVYYRATGAVVDEGSTVLVLTPGGRVDRGDYIEHVIVSSAEPWQPGRTYIVAMAWTPVLEAWQPTAYYESVFAIDADGTLAAMGTGTLAKGSQRSWTGCLHREGARDGQTRVSRQVECPPAMPRDALPQPGRERAR